MRCVQFLRAFAPVIMLSLLVVAGCGRGNGSSGGATSDSGGTVATEADAARLLTQATFGPTMAQINRTVSMDYGTWIDEQLQKPASLQLPMLQALAANPQQRDRMDAWWQNAINGEDQLRQRVAFALSEIFVVSDRETLSNRPEALAYYYDLLAKHAFGNFRELMEAVTLSPAMGEYLSMLGNEKPDPVRNIRPDENYARELMQLFTIGLVELNVDGTEKRDSQNQPIPTYDQAIIEGFAHVYTGWTFSGSPRFRNPVRNYLAQMEPFEGFHDDGEKRLLNGVVLPPGQSARADLKAALDNIFAHANVAPFISKQLIKRLITSNPTPAYVARVASVFNDSGGVRGDLAAVVKAILLDREARSGHLDFQGFGKLKEPLLRQAALWRAFGAAAANGHYLYANPDRDFGQAPLRSPSVFNFFEPDYQQPGPIADRGLVAPEFEITNETTIATTTNRLYVNAVLRYVGRVTNPNPADILLDIEREKSMAGDPPALVDHLNLLLMSGQMSAEMRNELIDVIGGIALGDGSQRVVEAIYLIVSSPEFAVQE